MWRHYTQHNDNQHNDTQHYGTQHNDSQHNDTQHNDIQHTLKLNATFSNKDTQHNATVVMLSVLNKLFMLSVTN
jgi:hypothetical protein